jgi:short-subunit dehydrogenase
VKSILIVGANSAIARACALKYKKEGYKLTLAARDLDSLQSFSKENNLEASCLSFDSSSYKEDWETLKLHPFDVILFAAGYLPEKKEALSDADEIEKTILLNGTAACYVCHEAAKILQKNGSGSVVGISSVAADRGKNSTYIYSAGKAAFSVFLDGLRNKLYPTVHVMNVKPGFVDTPMTTGMKKGFLRSSPELVANKIYKYQQKKRSVVYIKAVWRPLMFVIKNIPEFILKRKKL